MLRGDFASAWAVCDDVLRARAGMPCAHLPRHLQWLWDGTPVEGKRVLIHCYHGLGDTVMFLRFASVLKPIAREVLVRAQPALLRLLRSNAGIDQLLPLHDGWPEIERDLDVESMELAHVLRATPASLPAKVPYLHADTARLDATVATLRVGLVWSVSNWEHEARTIPFALLEPLFRIPDLELHALQRGEALARWPRDLGRISGSDSVEKAATVIRALDLVISVDSFPAHLAGALGVPVWTLLPEPSNWRWMTQREDSPWYPTMRLFRQPRPGDWTTVIARVADELRLLVAAKRSRAHAA